MLGCLVRFFFIMKAKDVVTWALVIYGLYKLAPTVQAAIESSQGAGSGGLGAGCNYGQYESTLQMPPWARLEGRSFTTEGEQ